MKKGTKIISLFLVLAFFAIMALGSGSNSSAKTATTTVTASTSNSVSTENSNTGKQTAPQNKITITDNRTQVPVTSFSDEEFETYGYLYENSIGDSLYFVIVHNNSEATVSVSGNATAKDRSGNPIGADDMSISVLGPGETSIGYFYFDSVRGIDSVDYQLTYSSKTRYKPVIANLEVNQVLNEKNVTVTVSNKGDINAQFVEAYALFFDSANNVISYSRTYLTDKDSEIKPGATLSAQLDIYGETYDHVDVYFVGRSDGRRTEVSSIVSDTDFSITEYKYEDSFGDTLWFLIIQNNSEYDVSISANGIAYDLSGNTLGADDTSIDILGAGQSSICYFCFDGVKNVDSVKYQLFYDTNPRYKDVLHDLSINATINDSNVIVSVTNNGVAPAQFVQVYALFLDNAGYTVGYDSAYITDDDSEIKSGATITKQLDTYSTFSDVEIILSGRYYGR